MNEFLCSVGVECVRAFVKRSSPLCIAGTHPLLQTNVTCSYSNVPIQVLGIEEVGSLLRGLYIILQTIMIYSFV